ncbi:MAG TPA: histidinol-phosphate transaminase [Terriglobia bacterium]|nr:histidinol-phosphate transaminase [Terriglobia bacterium]
MLRPRRAVERLKAYRPPREGRGGKLRLDFNENTVGCAPQVIRALRSKLNGDWLSRYPEYEGARETLARYFGVAAGELLLANGTDDAIKMLCDTFVSSGDELIVPAPTFPVYQFFHTVAGGRTTRVRYDGQFRVTARMLLAAVNKRTRWMAIANPNNPTGTVVSQRDLRTILRGAPDVLILVDEAYVDFSGQTILPWIRKYPNLVVTRTFSKAFGLAALRLGCLLTNAQLAEPMRRAQNPFAVNSLALACALEAIKHDKFVARYARQVCNNRDKLCRFLDRIGIPYVPSFSNFVLARVGAKASEIALKLRGQDILIRDWSYDPRLQGYLRFTIGSTEQTRRLIQGLSDSRSMMETRNGAGAKSNSAGNPPKGRPS